ncbi:unnamed protein product [Dovyalis caffra]|uniref:Uncharacterized protein n=1 Tax=Dovyalis caffra TaxID=77055 RepID=A0AAV1QV72_9ROSI|nr:unnamed protein product [Dovyalis caffra]
MAGGQLGYLRDKHATSASFFNGDPIVDGARPKSININRESSIWCHLKRWHSSALNDSKMQDVSTIQGKSGCEDNANVDNKVLCLGPNEDLTWHVGKAMMSPTVSI